MGTPKALLRIGGKTFLERILDAIAHSSVEHTVVVIGHHRVEIEPHVPASVAITYNPDYEKGMITSFQAGIRVLPAATDAALLFLVDHPIVETATIQALIAQGGPNRIVLPVHAGKRGHPVLFGADVLKEILALSVFEGANIVVRKDPNRIVQVPVNSPGVLMDIDTPEDFQTLQDLYEPR